MEQVWASCSWSCVRFVWQPLIFGIAGDSAEGDFQCVRLEVAFLLSGPFITSVGVLFPGECGEADTLMKKDSSGNSKLCLGSPGLAKLAGSL